jgi:hypothetical protein
LVESMVVEMVVMKAVELVEKKVENLVVRLVD